MENIGSSPISCSQVSYFQVIPALLNLSRLNEHPRVQVRFDSNCICLFFFSFFLVDRQRGGEEGGGGSVCLLASLAVQLLPFHTSRHTACRL